VVNEADLSLVASDASPSEDFLGFTCGAHYHKLGGQPDSPVLRRSFVGVVETVGEQHV